MDRPLNRRKWLQLMGSSVAGLAFGGCAANRDPLGSAVYPRAYSTLPFTRPSIDPRQVVRTVVGLRPFRPSGFVVGGERMGEKVVIHNYGHGGGGITLSWGSAALAVREAPDVPGRRAAVIGCGVMGLSTARLLQDRGWSVTIYSKDLPPHTTSNIAGGQWAPTMVFEEGRASPGFEAQFKEAARIAHHAFGNLVGGGYGVRWIENYYLGSAPMPFSYYLRELPELFPSTADLEPGQHPFPVPYVRRTVTMLIEPAIYLRRLLSDFRQAGGRVNVREFGGRDQLLALDEPVLFNCTGLGAAALFDDKELIPVRGQLVFLPPDSRLDYLTVGGGEGLLYMFPRSDGLLLGGTYQPGRDDTRPDPADTDRILRGHARLAEGMRVDPVNALRRK